MNDTDCSGWKQAYTDEMVRCLQDAGCSPKVREIAVLMDTARVGAFTIFIAGNGGSAAIANHFAIDVNKIANSANPELKKKFRCVSLAANASELTAWGNDVSFDRVFSAQLAGLAQPGDLVILVSASGTSPNIVAAGDWCFWNHVTSVLLTSSMKPLALRALADVSFVVDSQRYGIIEDIHMFALHLLCYWFKEGAN